MRLKQYALIILSFLIVAFGEPSRLQWLGVLAACMGYALFWYAVREKNRFWWALVWFFFVTLVHVSWMTIIEYVGPLILGAYIGLSLIVALQFALITLMVPKEGKLSLRRILLIGGVWVFFEYSRSYILSGYFWNPSGLSLTSTLPSLQFAAVVGVYGLSFWIMITNLLALNFRLIPFASVALVPYVFGGFWLWFHADAMKKNDVPVLSALLVQTAVLPDHRGSSLDQWQNILLLLKEYQNKPVDLIVFPEGTVPYPSDLPIYAYVTVFESFYHVFGQESLSCLPVNSRGAVGNAYWAQGIANLFDAEVIVGLEDRDMKQSFQAALHLQPGTYQRSRYGKRILIPVGEYIPFEWCKAFAARFGIVDSFTPGTQARLFEGKALISPSICYEEICGSVMREGRLLGANVFVNITNDGWYPGERLALSHFYHARLRAVENGIPLLRACNTGLTVAVDSLGRTMDVIPSHKYLVPSVLFVQVPLHVHKTPYTYWGDNFIFIIALLAIVFGLQRKKSCPK